MSLQAKFCLGALYLLSAAEFVNVYNFADLGRTVEAIFSAAVGVALVLTTEQIRVKYYGHKRPAS